MVLPPLRRMAGAGTSSTPRRTPVMMLTVAVISGFELVLVVAPIILMVTG